MASFMRTIVQPGADPGGDALWSFSKECAEVCNQAVQSSKSPTKVKICTYCNDLNQILMIKMNQSVFGMMVLQFIPRISICYGYDIHEYKSTGFNQVFLELPLTLKRYSPKTKNTQLMF